MPKPQETTDLYAALGVPKDAEGEAITKAYRKRARETHPDAGGDRAAFMAVQLAYDVLSDGERRKRYDETGAAELPQDPMAKARKAAVELVVSFIMQNGEAYDPIKSSRNHLVSGQNKLRQQKKNALDRAALLLRVREKLVYKGQGESLIGQALLSESENLTRNSARCDVEVENLERILNVLEEYEFQQEQEFGMMPSILKHYGI